MRVNASSIVSRRDQDSNAREAGGGSNRNGLGDLDARPAAPCPAGDAFSAFGWAEAALEQPLEPQTTMVANPKHRQTLVTIPRLIVVTASRR
jgi:hypothetical protein